METKKLHKLILMLSSDNQGEVFNAAQMIGRVLKEDHLDWHDLADRLLTDKQKIQMTHILDLKRSVKGNLYGELGEVSFTIFPTNRKVSTNDNFTIVINNENGKSYKGGFRTEDEAIDFIQLMYGG